MNSYYTALSIPAESLLFPPYVYLQASFLPLIYPLALFVGLFAVSSLLPVDNQHWSRYRMDALGTAAAAAALVGWARMSLILANDGWETKWFRLNWGTGFFLLLLIMIFWVSSNPRARIRLAPEDRRAKRDAAGVVMLTLLVLLFWGLATGFHGMAQATALKEGCAHHDEVTFMPTPVGLENKSYIHILHNDGRYYLLDPDIGKSSRESIVVLDSQVNVVHFTRVAARTDC